MSWTSVVVTVLVAVLGGGGAATIITTLARRKVTKVEAADRLNESTLEWAEQLKADAASARRDAHEARLEANGARVEMAAVRYEAESLAYELRRLRLAILDPYASIDKLRQLISEGPGNGVPHTPAGAR